MNLTDLSEELKKLLQRAGNAVGQSIQQTPQYKGAQVIGNALPQVAQNVANFKMPTQSIPFAGPALASLQRIQNHQQTPSFTPRDIYNLAAPVWQQPLRVAAQLKQTPVIQNFLPGQNLPSQELQPQGIGKIAFGNEPLKSYQQRYQEGYNLPIVGNIKGPASLPLFGAGIALSLMPQGGGSKVAEREIIGLAKNVSTVEEFTSLLKKSSPEVKSYVTKIFKDTKNPINTVEDLFRAVKGASPTVEKIINALQGAKPIRGAQENIYSKIRSQQAGALAGIGEQMKGEAGLYQKLGQLKGEMPKVSFESIKSQFQQPELDALYNKIEASPLSPFEKVTAQVGLKKLLGAEGGTIPNNSELNLLNQIFPKEFTQAVLDKRPFMQKLFANVTDALNIPRSLMASFDMSAPLRQGAFLIGRPKQWLPAFGEQFKYFFNPKAYEGLAADIQARPTYGLMKDAKLAITDMGPMLNQHEESFMSNIVDRIPGIGAVTQASNRAYSGFLNKLRADTFDDLVKSATTQGLDAKTLAPDIARFVNSATGRGELPGSLQRASVVLNGLMFSPRLLASRINLMNPAYYVSLPPFVRKEALKSLATFAGTAMTVLGLAKLSGAEVGADPRSADFGKIKFGNTRYDILAGFQQPIRLMAQLVSGHIISTTTGRDITLGEGYKPMTRADIVMNFLQSKESPVVGLAMGLLQGQNSIGQPFNVLPEVINRFIPMGIQDMYDLAKEKDSPLAALAAIPGMFGVGVQTYGSQIPSFQTTPTGKGTIKLNPVPGLAEDIANKITNTPTSNIPQDQWGKLVQSKTQATQNVVNLDKAKQEIQTGKTPTDPNVQQTSFNIKGTDYNGWIVGKNFLYVDENGDTQSPNLDTVKKGQISYQKSIDDAQYSLTADQLKRANDAKGWIDLTTNYIDSLNQYASTLDPKANKAELLGIQNKVADLQTQIKTYKSYGGFKKPKKPAKITISKVAVKKIPVSSFKIKVAKLAKPPKIKVAKLSKSKVKPIKIAKVKNTLKIGKKVV